MEPDQPLTVAAILPHLTERGQVEVDAAILRLQVTQLQAEKQQRVVVTENGHKEPV